MHHGAARALNFGLAMHAIPILQSIEPLADSSDLWFVDIWGVVHNGVRPYGSTIAACETFRQLGGTVLLVTNAPRPSESVIRQLDGIGVSRAAYDAVVSSGDVSRKLIADWAGHSILHIGPERDAPIFAGLGAQPGVTPSEAEVAVCTGLYEDEVETPDDYTDMLQELRQRDVPMICANPDIRVERDGRLIYCAGAIAAAYEALGGKVSYAGKPYQPIYELAAARGGELRRCDVPKQRILAIGDGASTDIAGASMFGIRSVYIASGVHVHADESITEAAHRLFPAGSTSRPIALMSAFAW